MMVDIYTGSAGDCGDCSVCCAIFATPEAGFDAMEINTIAWESFPHQW